jgi:hypothetical protein
MLICTKIHATRLNLSHHSLVLCSREDNITVTETSFLLCRLHHAWPAIHYTVSWTENKNVWSTHLKVLASFWCCNAFGRMFQAASPANETECLPILPTVCGTSYRWLLPKQSPTWDGISIETYPKMHRHVIRKFSPQLFFQINLNITLN